MTEAHDREQEIFARAMDLPKADRLSYLDEACAGDANLRAQVESLLNAMQQAGEQGFFDQPTSGLGDVSDRQGQIRDVLDDIQAGTIIGNYTVLGQLGEGGFG